MTAITCQNHPLHLLPESAALDRARRALFLADLHLGKTAVFRQSGLSVPDGPDATVLERLTGLVRRTKPEALVVLGDLFHARGQQMHEVLASLHAWRSGHAALHWIVVPGNHDRRVPWTEWLPGAEILPEGATLGPWALAHHPPAESARPVLCGHLHPGIALGHARQRKLKLPCFWRRRGALVLPAFGEFTGLKIIAREQGDSVWVPVDGRVVAVP